MNYILTLISSLFLGFTSQTNTYVVENRSPVSSKKPLLSEPEILYHFEEMPRVLTLPDGRLIAVFIRHKGPGLPAAENFQDVRARYSDDNGESWSEEEVLFRLPKEAGGFGYYVGLVDNKGEIHLFMLNDRATGRILPLTGGLKTPTPNLSAYGPVEPVVVELNNGTIWMLLRTQMGRFYESFSVDGSRWSGPKPSSILSSDSPAGFLRLTDGQLLMFVNSCRRFPLCRRRKTYFACSYFRLSSTSEKVDQGLLIEYVKVAIKDK